MERNEQTNETLFWMEWRKRVELICEWSGLWASGPSTADAFHFTLHWRVPLQPPCFHLNHSATSEKKRRATLSAIQPFFFFHSQQRKQANESRSIEWVMKLIGFSWRGRWAPPHNCLRRKREREQTNQNQSIAAFTWGAIGGLVLFELWAERKRK